MDIKNLIMSSKSRGFTLLEVIVALMIIATVMVSLISLSIQNIQLHEAARENTIAYMIAEEYMEKLITQQTVDENFKVDDEEIKENYPNVEVETKVEDIGTQDAAWAAFLPENTEVKILKVIVHWKDENGERTYPLETYIVRRMQQ